MSMSPEDKRRLYAALRSELNSLSVSQLSKIGFCPEQHLAYFHEAAPRPRFPAFHKLPVSQAQWDQTVAIMAAGKVILLLDSIGWKKVTWIGATKRL